MSIRRIAALATVLALPSALRAQATVFVVDDTPGPGVNFADLPTAVAAASDGDIILVRDGSYTGFTIDAKGLSILADLGAAPTIVGTVRVERLAQAQKVLLRGLATGTPETNGLQIDTNLGAVRVENCRWRGQDGFNSTTAASHPDGFHGVNLAGSANVAFSNCILEAGHGAHLYDINTDINGRGGAGIFAIDAQVALYQCTLRGGIGGSDRSEFALSGNRGGPGGYLDRGLVHSGSSTFTGGSGGGGGVAWMWSGCGNGGDGGAGFVLQAGEFREIDTTLSGGRGGGGAAAYSCRNGFDGAPFSLQNGTRTILPGTNHGDIEAPAPWPAGTTANLSFRGTPGDVVVLAMSIQPGFEDLLPLSGVLMLSGNPNVLVAGLIPSSGALNVPLTHPGLLRRGQGVVIHTQAAFVTTGASAVLGPFSVAVLTGP